MAGPVTHIILALKILCLLPSTIDKKEFIVGTSFPDIRYLANLDRSVTHIEPVSWHDVINEKSSFRAGMLFHNLVDIIRIQHFECYFYDRFNLAQYTPIYIKLFPIIMKTAEDSVLYSLVDNWSEIIDYFDVIYQEEKELCPNEAIIHQWHKALQHYFSKKPDLEMVNSFLSQTGGLKLPRNTEFNLHLQYERLLNNNLFIKQLNNFYATFEEFLSNEILETPAELLYYAQIS